MGTWIEIMITSYTQQRFPFPTDTRPTIHPALRLELGHSATQWKTRVSSNFASPAVTSGARRLWLATAHLESLANRATQRKQQLAAKVIANVAVVRYAPPPPPPPPRSPVNV